ncbi:MAG: acyl-CoA dehydrogenase [Gammaproteobacteria bacterium]|nr:MAG: acyl-CoA dehydrogenase [Gammaproteobacteria bacterium]
MTVWLVFGVLLMAVAVVLWQPQLRKNALTRPIMRWFSRALPPMSDTEREAIEAGDVDWDGSLFQGNPDWRSWLARPKPQLRPEEQAFMDEQVSRLCEMLDDFEVSFARKDLPEPVWEYIKRERFFGMIIPKEYGGLGFSALAHSAVVTTIASRSIAAAVTVMVPNSLGPAELLLHYGTQEQKAHYLPRLADGREIPCFALTSPVAGSDAGALNDTGVVCRGEWQGEEVIGVRLNWNKRYITLAPVATVLGLAVQLKDPEGLIGEPGDRGITLFLIPTNLPGVQIGRRHYPMYQAFMNGPTQGQDVFVPLDHIIGGVDYAGKGWQMLMECLAAGRSISLPALGTASGKMAYRLTGAYAAIRQQFGTEIANFEGVAEAMAQIAGDAYMLEAARLATAQTVDRQVKPAVLSAIAKYHMTEAGRRAITHAMDVHGGRGLIVGPRNYLANGYISNPIAVTVEGANILTRNLIIFGQGAMRCHPYVLSEIKALADDDLAAFDKAFWGHVRYVLKNLSRSVTTGLFGTWWLPRPVEGSVGRYCQQLTRMSSALALLTDVAMGVLGGELKRKERLSARLGDLLSHLYLASATLKFFVDGGQKEEERPYVEWVVERALCECEQAIMAFCRNFPNRILGAVLKRLVMPFGPRHLGPTDDLELAMVQSMVRDSDVRRRLSQFTYVPADANDATGRVEMAFLAVLAAAPAERKLRKAIRQGLVDQAAVRDQQLSQALNNAILTEPEAALIREADARRWDAIQVDDFSPEILLEPLRWLDQIATSDKVA